MMLRILKDSIAQHYRIRNEQSSRWVLISFVSHWYKIVCRSGCSLVTAIWQSHFLNCRLHTDKLITEQKSLNSFSNPIHVLKNSNALDFVL